MPSLVELRAKWAEKGAEFKRLHLDTLAQLAADVVADLEESERPAAGGGAPALQQGATESGYHVDPLRRTGETWRERLWTAPPDTRIGAVELGEALGRPRSWIYRHTSTKSGLSPLPCRKLDGELTFVVGEIRRWLDDHEEVIRPGPREREPLHVISAAGRRKVRP